MATRAVQIYVGLLDEGTVVWRPVQAEHVRDDVYIIIDQPYNRADETWEFEPGDCVVCERVASSEGHILAATRKIEHG